MTNAFILCDLLWKVQKSHEANREGSFKQNDINYKLEACLQGIRKWMSNYMVMMNDEFLLISSRYRDTPGYPGILIGNDVILNNTHVHNFGVIINNPFTGVKDAKIRVVFCSHQEHWKSQEISNTRHSPENDSCVCLYKIGLSNYLLFGLSKKLITKF